jgi:hypothetical protein
MPSTLDFEVSTLSPATFVAQHSAPPAQQGREHLIDALNCWCFPRIDFVDPETGNMVIVHNQVQ